MTRRAWAIVTVVILVLCALRLIHLNADTPGWVSPGSAGEYVDEGYKTLSPRNLVLFGETHWHPADDYEGWMKTSPVTNWTYYLAFRLGGVELASARVATVIIFGLFLFLVAFTLGRRLPRALVVGAILLLGLDSTLFFFSRIALFEIPIVLFIYAGVFVLACTPERSAWIPFAVGLALAPPLALGLKLSVLVYLAPMLAGLLVRALFLRGMPRSPWVIGTLVLGAAGVVATLVATHWLWSERLGLNPISYARNVLSSPLPLMSPFLFLGGWLAAVHLLVSRPREILESPYRTALISLVLVGPLMFGLFAYDPPRYYVPLLPAYVLLACEWFSINGRRIAPPLRGLLPGAVAVAGLGLWIYAALRVISHWLPMETAQTLGVSRSLLILIIVPIALAAGVLFWTRRRRWLEGTWIQAAIVTSWLLLGAQSVARLGAFYSAPRYEGEALRQAIAAAVPSESSIIGDWAPFFALGTDLRPLYMNRMFNVADRIEELRPSYILFSDTEDSHLSFARLQANPAVEVGEPLLTGEYNQREVRLHALRFTDDQPAHTGPDASGS